MAMLHPVFSALVTDASTLPLDEEAAQPLLGIHAQRRADVARQAIDLFGAGMGDFLVANGVPRRVIPKPVTPDMLKNDDGFKELLAGERTLQRGVRQKGLVSLVQRTLQAVLVRSGQTLPRELALARYGADGDYGSETAVAVALLRSRTEAAPGQAAEDEGSLGQAEARLLLGWLEDGAPAPELFEGQTEETPSGSAAIRIKEIARAICNAEKNAPYTVRVDGKRYRYWSELFGTNPEFKGAIEATNGIWYGVRPEKSYWKCNIFGGCVLSMAEVPVPTFRIAGAQVRHYPRAEDFGDRLARKRGWTLVRHLDHRDPADATEALKSEANDAQIRDLLLAARPGDMYFVDHPGAPKDGGGHTRVCVEAAEASDPDAKVAFAQAREDAAHVVRDGVARVGGGQELQHWLLRYEG